MGLLDRANLLMNQPEQEQNQYADLPPLRWFNTKAGDRNGDYMFGMYVLPFIPEGSEKEETFVEQYKHYQMPVGFDAGKLILQSRVCVEKTDPNGGIECPFCRVINVTLTQTQNEEKRKEILRFRAKLNAYANVIPTYAANAKIVHSDEEGKTPYLPHIIQVNQTVYDAIAKWMIQNEVFDNPAVWPFDVWNALQLQITIKRQGSRKMDVRYSATFGAKRGSVADRSQGDEYAMQHLQYLYDNIYDVAKIFRVPTAEKVSEEFEQEAEAFAKILAQKSEGSSASPFNAKRGVPPPPSNMKTPAVESPSTPTPAVAPVAEAAPAAAAPKPTAGTKKHSFGAPPASAAGAGGAKPF